MTTRSRKFTIQTMKHFLLIASLLTSLAALSMAKDPEVMTDAKIVGISLTTDDVQIQGSEYMAPKISYFDLRNFANAMITDYRNYQSIIQDFTYRNGITPEASQAAMDIEARGKQVMAELAQLKGFDLERRYIDAQVELHEKTLDTIDRVFMPNTSSQELKNLVNNIRPAIMGRYQWALKIQALYAGGASESSLGSL